MKSFAVGVTFFHGSSSNDTLLRVQGGNMKHTKTPTYETQSKNDILYGHVRRMANCSSQQRITTSSSNTVHWNEEYTHTYRWKAFVNVHMLTFHWAFAKGDHWRHGTRTVVCARGGTRKILVLHKTLQIGKLKYVSRINVCCTVESVLISARSNLFEHSFHPSSATSALRPLDPHDE